jgi:hypothetical protein
MILLDASIFVGGASGKSAELWVGTLTEWVRTGFSRYISVLDRDDLCPDIPGINKIPSPLKKRRNLNWNRRRLQQLCDEALTEVFVTAADVTPSETPSVRVETDIGKSTMQAFAQRLASITLALPEKFAPLACDSRDCLSSHSPDVSGPTKLKNQPTLAQFASDLREVLARVFQASAASQSRRSRSKRSCCKHTHTSWRSGLRKLKHLVFGIFRAKSHLVTS